MTQPTEAQADIVERLLLPWFTNGCEAYQREAAAEITRLRAQLAEAELRGVKAGLDEAAKWLDNWGDATMGQEIGSYYAATAIRAIDPTTLTAGEGDHG
jgi:hypothetical protein